MARKVPCFPQEVSRWNKTGKVAKKKAPKVAAAVIAEIPEALAKGRVEPALARPVSIKALISGIDEEAANDPAVRIDGQQAA